MSENTDPLMLHSSTNPSTRFSIIEEEESGENHRKKSLFERYHWKMTDFFYLHLFVFFFNGLFGGLIIWYIENHSSARNTLMKVSYLDAWFMAVSTISACGLTTINFAQLARSSQILLMFLSFVSCFAMSTLPALFIKTYTHRTNRDHHIDNDNDSDDDDDIVLQNSHNLPIDLHEQFKLLPTPSQLRYRSYITCILLILSIYVFVYVTGFIAMGVWLQTHQKPEYLEQNNGTLNPWFISCILTLFTFNQNGLTPFSTSLTRFVDDVYLNLIIVALILCGSTFFPLLLRNVILLLRRLAPRRHKVIFDYILMNNHHLSTLLFPLLQTQIYVVVSIVLYAMGIGISLILDMNSKDLADYPYGTRIMIFVFQTVNLRFCGFQSIDISVLTTATLLMYLLLMATKPQMLCALDESPFEIHWLTLKTQATVDSETEIKPKTTGKMHLSNSESEHRLSTSSIESTDALLIKQVNQFLRRKCTATRELAKLEFSRTVDDCENICKHSKRLHGLRLRLFIIQFIRLLLKHTFNYFILTRTWLFVFIFFICAFEYQKMNPIDPNITLMKIVFEIISAFGGVGMSLGYPGLVTSFSTVLSCGSKVILILTMLMGRHRGLLASMKDQQIIEYSAANVLLRHREECILRYRIAHNRKDEDETTFERQLTDSKVTFF